MKATFIILGTATAIRATGLANGIGDDVKVTRQAEGPKAVAKIGANPSPAKAGAPSGRLEHSVAEEIYRLEANYENADRRYSAHNRGPAIPQVSQANATEIEPDYAGVVRRVFDLGASAPKHPAVRDAMLWMIENAQNGSEVLYPGEFAQAASWLVRHFGDDPDAVRVGLELDNFLTASRDNLLLTFYASAKSRESKGLARLALAQYLQRKAIMAEGARKVSRRPVLIHDDVVGADGTLHREKAVQPDGEYAYLLHLKQCDVSYLRAEAERLYEEVIAEYGDLPYITTRARMQEALLKQPEPKRNGKPLTDEDRRRIEARLARRSTLGRAAEARLDDWYNLAVGKPAPEIRGVDFHRNPLKLSDYRGKIVAVVFWATWCGPCMREIPREKALVERMKGRPFALLGVNSDLDPEAARKVIEAQKITWPNWHDGEPGAGPIGKLYHVRAYPTVYVIDAEGKIRSKDLHGGALDLLIEKLVADQESAGR